MHRFTNHPHRMLAALAGVFLLGAVASTAEAGHGHGRKWKRQCSTPYVHRVHYARSAHVHESCGLPAFAGFVGGLIVGATVSNAHAAPPPRYDYYDPYCDLSWTSLDACTPHFRRCDHPRVVRVVEVRTGRCVDRRAWHHGDWHDVSDHRFDEDD